MAGHHTPNDDLEGLKHYGYEKKWRIGLPMVVHDYKNAVDYNGTIPEKYDVVSATQGFLPNTERGTGFNTLPRKGLVG